MTTMELLPIERTLAALNHGFSESGGTRSSDVPTSRSPGATLSLRRLDPKVASIYLPPYGLLSNQRAPGGTGDARRITANGQDIASSGGPIFDFSRFSYIPPTEEAEASNPKRDDSTTPLMRLKSKSTEQYKAYQKTEDPTHSLLDVRGSPAYQGQAQKIYQKHAWDIPLGSTWGKQE